MSFFNNLKRAFGFNDNGEDIDDVVDYDLSRSPFANPFRRNEQPRRDLYEDADPYAVEDEPQPVQQPEPKAEPVVKSEPLPEPEPKVEPKPQPEPEPIVAPEPVVTPVVQATSGTTTVSVALIDTVVSLINASLPPAMKQYIDTEGQRRDVEKALAPHVAHIAQQSAPVTSDAGLKALLKTSDMQRRAAQNRANDLSVRLTEVESENEKLEVERKSLLNKIKVLEMSAGNADEAQQVQAKLDEATKQVAELNGQLERSSAALAERDTTIESLHEQLNEANEGLKIAEQLAARIDEMEQFKQRKNEENRDLRDRVAQLERENTETDRLKAELQLATDETIRLKKEVETLNRTNRTDRDKHNRRDVELANRLNDLKAQVASAASLAESYKDNLDIQLKTVDDLRAQLEKATAAQAEAQQQLASAKDELKQVRKDSKSLEPAVEQLKKQLADAEKNAADAKAQAQEATDELQAAHILNEDLMQQIEELRAEKASQLVVAEEPMAIEEPAVEEPVVEEPVEETAPATVETPEPEPSPVEETPVEEPAPVVEEEPEPEPAVEADEPKEEYGGKSLGITLDDIDDVDWLIPVEPDPVPEPEPEPEPEPVPEPKPKTDPRQLSLW